METTKHLRKQQISSSYLRSIDPAFRNYSTFVGINSSDIINSQMMGKKRLQMVSPGTEILKTHLQKTHFSMMEERADKENLNRMANEPKQQKQ